MTWNTRPLYSLSLPWAFFMNWYVSINFILNINRSGKRVKLITCIKHLFTLHCLAAVFVATVLNTVWYLVLPSVKSALQYTRTCYMIISRMNLQPKFTIGGSFVYLVICVERWCSLVVPRVFFLHSPMSVSKFTFLDLHEAFFLIRDWGLVECVTFQDWKPCFTYTTDRVRPL